MEYLTLITVFALVYGECICAFDAKDFAVGKQCSVIRRFKVRKAIPYEEFNYSADASSFGVLDIQKKFKLEDDESNRTQQVCCDGYQNYDEKSCIPVCTVGCGNRGICSSPGVCTCEEGYMMDNDLHRCKPICDIECISGTCIAPNVCSCEEGYQWSQEEPQSASAEPDCKPICNNCAAEEICVDPHICRCKQGYARMPMDRPDNVDISKCQPICQKECINARCVKPDICECYENYSRIDAFTCDVRMHVVSDFAIPKNCTATVIEKEKEVVFEEIFYYDEHMKKASSYPNYRIKVVLVNRTISTCCDGYQNFDDERCIPVCSKVCGIFGICSAPEVCTCNEGFVMDNSLHECKPKFSKSNTDN